MNYNSIRSPMVVIILTMVVGDVEPLVIFRTNARITLAEVMVVEAMVVVAVEVAIRIAMAMIRNLVLKMMVVARRVPTQTRTIICCT